MKCLLGLITISTVGSGQARGRWQHGQIFHMLLAQRGSTSTSTSTPVPPSPLDQMTLSCPTHRVDCFSRKLLTSEHWPTPKP
jgi:hypothetical protein